jgi:hypothetical protein
MVIFDSTVSPTEVEAVYVEGAGEQLAGPELEGDRSVTAFAGCLPGGRPYADRRNEEEKR